jgi:hypothetical protein
MNESKTNIGNGMPNKKIWRPSHYLKSNGAAKYVLGIGMVPKLYKGRVHVLAKVPKVLQSRADVEIAI